MYCTTMKTYEAERTRAIQNALVLASLNQYPIEPAGRRLPPDDGSRRLPLKLEHELCESLAYISATVKDSDRVVAVAIEEHAEGADMSIRLASNTGEILDAKEGLMAIAELLSRLRRKEATADQTQKQVFSAIVKMDCMRILDRLGFKSRQIKVKRNCQKKNAGTSILIQIQRMLATCPRNELVENGGIGKAQQRINAIVKAFLKLQESRAIGVDGQFFHQIETILSSVSELLRTVKIEAILTVAAKQNKLEIPKISKLLKLARYDMISSLLTRAARKYTIFTRIHVDIIQKPTLQVSDLRKQVPSYDAVMERFKVKRVVPGTVKKMKQNFRCLEQQCMKRPKVHAEIQLLLFYETNSQLRQPRVICSNKSACYLCYLLFSLHGKFVTPKRHGRLYNSWVLPHLPFGPVERSVRATLRKMNLELERQIKNFLQQPIIRPPGCLNESTFTLYSKMSSYTSLLNSAGPLNGTGQHSNTALTAEASRFGGVTAGGTHPSSIIVATEERQLGIDGANETSSESTVPVEDPMHNDLPDMHTSTRRHSVQSSGPAQIECRKGAPTLEDEHLCVETADIDAVYEQSSSPSSSSSSSSSARSSSISTARPVRENSRAVHREQANIISFEPSSDVASEQQNGVHMSRTESTDRNLSKGVRSRADENGETPVQQATKGESQHTSKPCDHCQWSHNTILQSRALEIHVAKDISLLVEYEGKDYDFSATEGKRMSCFVSYRIINNETEEGLAIARQERLGMIRLSKLSSTEPLVTDRGAALSARELRLDTGQGIVLVKFSFNVPCMSSQAVML